MKTINVTFTDEEAELLENMKNKISWHDFILTTKREDEKMENKNQMPLGTWEKIDTAEYKPEDKIKFDVNITQKVVVVNPIPQERTGNEGGVYYNFEVSQDGKNKIIQTSAWTLLRELKKADLKPGMVLNITKKLVKGKQFFEVIKL